MICGQKLSICCTLLSVWGFVMLGLMGIFLKYKSPAFLEDLPINEEDWADTGHSEDYIYERYDQAAYNCFIASGLYVLTFVVSFIMWQINNRRSLTMT